MLTEHDLHQVRVKYSWDMSGQVDDTSGMREINLI